MKKILCIPLLLLAINLTAQVNINDPAPEILVDTWVDNNAYEFNSLDGKVIVLDFWFTHCAPCIYTIPHLNDLSKLYIDDNIVFVAVTFEKEDEVAKFLKKKEILANIGIDTSYQLINAFEVTGYPTTFLIDSKGILKWRGYPNQLNSEMIDMVLDKKYYPKIEPDHTSTKTRSTGDLEENIIYPITVAINDYMDGASGLQINSEEVSIVNKSLDYILAMTLNTSKSRISISDSNNYDIRFKIPKELQGHNIMDVLTESILHELGYKSTLKNKTVEGYQLKLINNSVFIENAIDTTKVYFGLGTTTTKTQWKGEGIQIFDLIKELENRFDVYILDTTQINGYFEFVFSIESFAQAKTDLFKAYGLSLIPKKLELEILRVE